MARKNILPKPGLINRIRRIIGCRYLKPVGFEESEEVRNSVESLLIDGGIGVNTYYREALELAELLGLEPGMVKSLLVYLGLTYQLPFSTYYLIVNSGIGFKGYNPLSCPGYMVVDGVFDPGVRVHETPSGVVFDKYNGSGEYIIEPQIIDAFIPVVNGYSYVLIDELVGKGLLRNAIDLFRRVGTHVYMYYMMIIIDRIAGLTDNYPLARLVFGSRLKTLYDYAWATINIFRRLMLREKVF